MTYRELLVHLEDLEDEQLSLEVMCLMDDEYYQPTQYDIKEKDGRLRDGHPYLIIE